MASVAASSSLPPAKHTFLRVLHSPDTAFQLLTGAHAAGSNLEQLLFATDQEWQDPLLIAVLSGDEAAVSQLLGDEAAQLDPSDFRTHNALIDVAMGGDVAVLQLLLQCGVPADAHSLCHRTSLHYTCMQGNADVVAVLTAAGADICFCDPEGSTPLMLAAERGRTAVVCMLLKNSCVKIDAVNEYGESALNLAACSASPVTVYALLDAGADLLAGCQDDCSPLALAAAHCMCAFGRGKPAEDDALGVLYHMLHHPRTAGVWTAEAIAAAALETASRPTRSYEHADMQFGVMMLLLDDASARWEADAPCSATASPLLLEQLADISKQRTWIRSGGRPPALLLVASVFMRAVVGQAELGVSAEQRAMQQLLVGAAGVLRAEECADEGNSMQQQDVCERETAPQTQQLQL